MGCSTDLCRRCELTLRGATRCAVRITHSVVDKLACAGVATGRVNAFARVTVFAALYDAVAAHIQRDELLTGIGVHEAASIHSAAS